MPLPRHLHWTADPAVLPVPPDVTTPGVSGGAAPGGTEAASVGAGRVQDAAVDEGEPAGGRAGGGGGGGGGGAVVLTVSPVPGEMVGLGVSGGAAPGPGEASRRGAGGVRHSLVDEGEHTGGLCHGSCRVSVARACGRVPCWNTSCRSCR